MKIVKLIIVITWMIVIFLFSNQPANDSTKISDGLILKTVRIIERINHKKYNDEEILNKFVKPVRKTAHFVIYFLLGVFVFLLIKEYDVKNIIVVSLLICSTYAVTDEIHQIFVEGRSGEILDVINDSISSFIGIYLLRKITKY